MACKIPVQICEYWTVAVAMRCVSKEQIFVLSVIQEVLKDKPTYEIIASRVQEAGDNIVYVKVMPWSEDGNYNFHSPPGQPICTADFLALGIQVYGQTLLMTQHGGSSCRTTFEPPIKGGNGRQQRWRFIYNQGENRPLCYGFEYSLLGGKNFDEWQTLACYSSQAQNSSLEPPGTQNGNSRFGDRASQSSWAGSTRFDHDRDRAPGPPTPRNAANQSTGPKLDPRDDDACLTSLECGAGDIKETLYLESFTVGGGWDSCQKDIFVADFFVTLAPFNVTVSCNYQKDKKLSIKEAVALYRQPNIFVKGCRNEWACGAVDRVESTDDCLFIALDDCSGYTPRCCS